MKRLVVLAVAILILPAVLIAQSSNQPATQQPATASPGPATQEPAPKELAREDEIQPGDSPLVRAAKKARAKKKGKTSKVIDNQDVKNSTGKLILITEKPVDPAAAAVVPALPDETRKDPKAVSAAVLATQRVETAKKDVEDLEKELRRLEDDFYNEDDANYRDGVIEPRFEQAKKQLDTARRKLLDAREEQQKLEAQAATRRSEP